MDQTGSTHGVGDHDTLHGNRDKSRGVHTNTAIRLGLVESPRPWFAVSKRHSSRRQMYKVSPQIHTTTSRMQIWVRKGTQRGVAATQEQDAGGAGGTARGDNPER